MHTIFFLRKLFEHTQGSGTFRHNSQDIPDSLRLLNALNSEDRGLKVRFSLATIVFETFELILCQMLSSQGKNAPSNPYPHYLVRLATSRFFLSKPKEEKLSRESTNFSATTPSRGRPPPTGRSPDPKS